MAKKDIEIGLNATGENDSKSFNPDDADARKKRIEEARKLLEDYPAEEDSTVEDKPVEEPETTAAGITGAVVRGVAPTVAEAGAGTIIGLPFGQPLMGARLGPLAGQLGDIAVNTVNAVYGTHYPGPKEAVTHFLDKIGVPEPKSSAEKITEAVASGISEMGTGAMGFKAAGGLMKPGLVKKGFELMGEKPIQQAIVGGVASGEMEKVKEAGGGTLEQLGKGLGLGILTGTGLSALEPSVKAGLQALKAVDVPAVEKAINVLRDVVAPQKELPALSITETAAKALKGDEASKKLLAEAAKGTTPEIQEAIKGVNFESEIPYQISTTSPQYQALAKKATSVPESELKAAQDQVVSEMNQKSNDLLNRLGATENFSGLNDKIKSTMETHINDFIEKEKPLYDAIETKIGEQQFTASNALKAVEEKLAKQYQGDTKMLSGIERKIIDLLKPKQKTIKSTLVDEFGNPIKQEIETINPSYNKINTLKKQVGAYAGSKGRDYFFPDEEIGNAKYYYSKLIDDLDAAANSTNIKIATNGTVQPIKNVVKLANKFTKDRKTVEDNMTKMFGQKLSESISPKIQTAGYAAATGDAEQIKNIMQAIPDKHKSEVSASAIKDAIQKKGELDIPAFVQWYGSIKSETPAYNALFQNLPEGAAKDFDNLYVVAKNMEKSLGQKLKVAKLSDEMKKSLTFAEKAKDIGAFMLTGFATHHLLHSVGIDGSLGAMISMIAGGMGARTRKLLSQSNKQALESFDNFVTSPEFAEYVAKAKGDPDIFNKRIPQLMREPIYTKFAKAVGPETAKTILFSIGRSTEQMNQQPKENNLGLQGMYRPAEQQ